ncbi:hypothetical protein HXZ94_10895 [Empedobacter falsenii]|uniref:hypothetical protein n=1 Tax=Empedobacter falsenii TaxID=343874 RepID=UPI002578250D|nr:hypothetical protein [Empedobacter falsenii]MDM1299003.1 hypothetical protein [Empedobacter falsenii]MDM1318796.1 hypothetical protein [Empedobacter falsenii]
MKCFIYLFLPFIFILSCNKKTQNNSSHIQKGFISESGTYYWNLNKKIVIKNIGDGGKIFAILDKLNNVIYQLPFNNTFSDYHYYSFYIDENQNAYYYNSDLDDYKALIWNNNLNKYDTINDFCSNKISLPVEFKKEIQSHVNNCESLK